MPVYLLCFDKKFRHAKHYIGFVQNMEGLPKRLNHHKKGTGSRLMAAVAKAGIGFSVARTWPDGDRNFERKLKNRKEASALCPHCKTALAERKKRRRVLANEAKVIEKLNAPSVITEADRDALNNSLSCCPVVQKFDESKSIFNVTVKESQPIEAAGPSVAELLTKAKEIYAKSQSDTNPSRWKRIWSRVARFLRLS